MKTGKNGYFGIRQQLFGLKTIQHDPIVLDEALKAIQFDPEEWEHPDKFMCFDWKANGNKSTFFLGCMRCMGLQTRDMR